MTHPDTLMHGNQPINGDHAEWQAAQAAAEPVKRILMTVMECLTDDAISRFAKASRLVDSELAVQRFASMIGMHVIINATPPAHTEAMRLALEALKFIKQWGECALAVEKRNTAIAALEGVMK